MLSLNGCLVHGASLFACYAGGCSYCRCISEQRLGRGTFLLMYLVPIVFISDGCLMLLMFSIGCGLLTGFSRGSNWETEWFQEFCKKKLWDVPMDRLHDCCCTGLLFILVHACACGKHGFFNEILALYFLLFQTNPLLNVCTA